MKGVRIINAARGVLINDQDLRVALDNGQVAGLKPFLTNNFQIFIKKTL